MKRTILSLALGAALIQSAWAQSNEGGLPPTSDASIPVSYVGSNARVSLGINNDLDVLGELLFVFGEDGDSAWLTEAWLGQGGAGGVKLDYHWLWGGMTRDDTIERPDQVKVAKAFLAFDQNPFKDRKASVGFGFEREHGFVDLYLSHAISGERLLSANSLFESVLLTGVEGDRPYQQTETTETITRSYAKPYDWGVGLRGGHYFNESLVRLRAGLDYEKGDYESNQTTFSVGIDKYFRNSGHSLSLELESYRKDGLFEQDRNDTRGWLLWRYDFGKGGSFRVTNPTRSVEVSREVPGEPAPPIVVRNEIEISNDTYFRLDSAQVDAETQASLAEVLDAISGGKRVSRVQLIGHTCDLGSDEYNQKLSVRRAEAVRDYLVARGIPADEFDISGQGELSPKYPNDGEPNRKRNRRVDINFLTVEESSRPAPPTTRTITEWVTEPVAAPAPWIERALRNPAQHKRTVDVYRFEKVEIKTTLGEREYLNRAPLAVDDAVSQHACEAITIPVLANDSDPDGDAIGVVSVGTPAAGGSVSINDDSSLTYTPPQNGAVCAGGTDSFTYTIGDVAGLSDSAVVTVSFSNSAPVAVDDTANTAYQTPALIDAIGNDSDPDGDAISIVSTTQPAHGTVEIDDDGHINYVPESGFSGDDSFTYSISDGRETDVATVSVTVEAPASNNPPVAVDDAVTTPYQTSTFINAIGNDSDPDGDAISIISTTQPAHGNVEVGYDGLIHYIPESGFSGVDSFTYTISDGFDSDVATVSVTVEAPVNNPPVAVDDVATTPYQTPAFIDAIGNDSDPDGDAISIVSTAQPAHGNVEMGDDGRIHYIPESGFSGVDSFTYTISDGFETAVATISVTVESPVGPANNPPVALSDTATTQTDVPVVIAVLANDSDADGDTLSLVSVSSPGNGTALIEGDQVRYTPNPAFVGVDSFTYTISDGDDVASATVSVTVTPTGVPGNNPPLARNDIYNYRRNTPVTMPVLANDEDPDNDELTIIDVQGAQSGQVTIIENGTKLYYVPNPDSGALEYLVYTISDGRGGTASAIVTLYDP